MVLRYSKVAKPLRLRGRRTPNMTSLPLPLQDVGVTHDALHVKFNGHSLPFCATRSLLACEKKS